MTLMGQLPLVTLLALAAVTSLLTDRFLSSINLTNLLLQSSIMSVIAMGMTFVIVAGGFDLSVGSVAALSGCVAALVMLKTTSAAGVAAGIAAGALVGLANGLAITALNVNPFITTLGTMVLIRGVVFLLTGGQAISGAFGLPDAFVRFGAERVLGVHDLVWVPAILLAVLSGVLNLTPYGRKIFATGGNRDAADLSGIRVNVIVTSTYAWCGLLARVAGGVVPGRPQSRQPAPGEFYELTAVAAVVLGGAGLHGGGGRLFQRGVGGLIHGGLRHDPNPLH